MVKLRSLVDVTERDAFVSEAIMRVERTLADDCAFRIAEGICQGFAERNLRCPECPKDDPHCVLPALEAMRNSGE